MSGTGEGAAAPKGAFGSPGELRLAIYPRLGQAQAELIFCSVFGSPGILIQVELRRCLVACLKFCTHRSLGRK
jgi:hypothetical protein